MCDMFPFATFAIVSKEQKMYVPLAINSSRSHEKQKHYKGCRNVALAQIE